MASEMSEGAGSTDRELKKHRVVAMDDRCRWVTTVTMFLRLRFRSCFGESFSDRWGFFVDHNLSKEISDYSYWIDYPKGDDVLRGNTSAVLCAVISNDESILMTGCEDGLITEWDLVTHLMIRQWRAHDSSVDCLAFRFPWIISGSADCSVKVWSVVDSDEVHQRRQVHCLEGHFEMIQSVGINKRNTQVISGSADYSIRVWSLRSGVCLREMYGHSKSVTSLIWWNGEGLGSSPVISGSKDGSIRVWNTKDGTMTRVISNETGSSSMCTSILSISLNCDASLIACASGDAWMVHRWPEMDTVIQQSDKSASLCRFHPKYPSVMIVDDKHEDLLSDSLWDMSGGVTYQLQLWDVSTPSKCIRSFDEHNLPIMDVCFTPDGSRVISVSSDYRTNIMDISDVL